MKLWCTILASVYLVKAQNELPCRRKTPAYSEPKPSMRALEVSNVTSNKAIGCCPNGAEDGKPFGPGKACCCDKVYHTDDYFCCMPSGCDGTQEVLPISTDNIALCDSYKNCPAAVPGLKNGELITCTDYSPGSKCGITCDSGYQPMGPVDEDMYHCDSGSWSVSNQTARMNSCCLAQCPPVPEQTQVDLFIVLDKSSSIGMSNFEYVREFVKLILSELPLGPDLVQVQLTTYNSVVEDVFVLGYSHDIFELEALIDGITYKGKGTHTGKALKHIVDNALPSPDNRPDVDDMVLLVTDGRSKDYKIVQEAVATLHDVSEVYVIGVGTNIRVSELNFIASDADEDHYRQARDYSELPTLNQWVLQSQCPRTCQ